MNIRAVRILLPLGLALLPASAMGQKSWQKGPYPSFLPSKSMPSAVNYLPAPPERGSAAFTYDSICHFAAKPLRDTGRGRQAAADAVYRVYSIAPRFANAFGLDISEGNTPQLYELLRFVINDAGNATGAAKRHYKRVRPYVQFDEPTLVPKDEAYHRTSGSFPSAHSAAGWAVGLVLAEISPDRAEALMKCAFDFGYSRVIAGYHYESDVYAGRLAASTAVAVLHGDKDFRRRLSKAKKECSRKRKAQP